MRNFLRQRRRQAPERGVTLVETLVVITVMTLLLVLVLEIFLSAYDIYSKQSARIAAATGTVLAARSISDFAHGADEVLASYVINGTTYTSSSTTLVLQVPSIEADGDIIPLTYDYIAFTRDATDTDEIISDTDAAVGSARFDGMRVVTADNVTMTFLYNAPDEEDATRISLYLVNSATVDGATFQSPAWTSIFLRNK